MGYESFAALYHIVFDFIKPLLSIRQNIIEDIGFDGIKFTFRLIFF
jgi:hypothetical protein